MLEFKVLEAEPFLMMTEATTGHGSRLQMGKGVGSLLPLRLRD